MRKFTAMIGGTLLGAAAWGASALISGVLEPFDSLPGFLVVQIALSIAAALTGFRAGGGVLVSALLGNYLGLNLYPYVMGGAETRAWALLGAVTTIFLIIIPALIGGTAALVRKRWRNGER